ncbi:penicillin-binding protein activator [Halopseudomonas nanhaiensis]|uniref:penicillin-binding protein activator n=1 Tax=Halopseudomonas nanhaiensis TaxID=2830842 RepID=UPI001CC03BF2|nr:penicillin-binding protein activator [Halopseudomonas nanhaiensis]UAW98991.1 penicillin-binding protein activator [Halopseudomonas nanhaiensis]
MPRINRLPVAAAVFAAILAGCSSPPKQLSDLPRTPQASAEELLKDADRQSGAEANLLRLQAARAASLQDNPKQVLSILERIPQSDLPLDQQMLFSTLQADSLIALEQPEGALRALRHPSMLQIETLPMDEQVRIQLLRAEALDATGDPVASARERVYVDGLLPAEQQPSNHEAIWSNLTQASTPALEDAAATATGELAGWISLALIARQHGNLDIQVRELKKWQEEFADHPAAEPLPETMSQLLELHASRPRHVALLLPFQGPLAGPAQALRDGFLASQYQAYSEGIEQPRVSLYDSTSYSDLSQFYREAQADGVDWIIGPLERDQVSRLARMQDIPLPTLALNYTDEATQSEQTLFQFGLAPEDEARSAAERAWNDGHRSMGALVAQTDWAERAYQAFRQAWEAQGGVFVGRETIDQPATMASQIGDLLQIRQSEQRNSRIKSVVDDAVVQPTPRQDLDALFLSATPQQARQIKPTLAFQYAAELPVYATSHVYQLSGDPTQNADLEGIMVAEVPWLLTRDDELYPSVSQNWPQATGALGRLYAMGIDAQRIFSRLPQMRQHGDARLDGATGELRLAEDGRVIRATEWGVIEDGQVRPVGPSQP